MGEFFTLLSCTARIFDEYLAISGQIDTLLSVHCGRRGEVLSPDPPPSAKQVNAVGLCCGVMIEATSNPRTQHHGQCTRGWWVMVVAAVSVGELLWVDAIPARGSFELTIEGEPYIITPEGMHQ